MALSKIVPVLKAAYDGKFKPQLDWQGSNIQYAVVSVTPGNERCKVILVTNDQEKAISTWEEASSCQPSALYDSGELVASL